MRKLSPLLLTAALLAAVAVQPVRADDWHGHGGYHDHYFDHWHNGNWFHGFHEGRDGWWWIVDGGWFFYPAPVYPYPDPYTPPTVVVETAPAGTVVEHAYYYCANPPGYYPSVPQCYSPWQKVLSTATTAAPAVVVPAPQPVPAPAAPVSTSSQHAADEKKLHALETELRHIDLTGQQAGVKLQALDKNVEDFRQSLYSRSYNVLTLSKDAEKLQQHIADEQGKLLSLGVTGGPPNLAPPPPEAPPGGTATPAPGSIPPGSAVSFPSQQ
jgi:hypothetical protein